LLLVGVGSYGEPWSNIVEDGIAATHETIFCGLERSFPKHPYVRADGRHLPFRTGAMDLVVSNAVVEHVGGPADQRVFLDEHARVGKHWVATTPNRWFPVESHTNTVLLHWLPTWRARRREFTRLLSRRELVRLVAGLDAGVSGCRVAPTFIAAAPPRGVRRLPSRHARA
jgi:hypothetical protein